MSFFLCENHGPTLGEVCGQCRDLLFPCHQSSPVLAPGDPDTCPLKCDKPLKSQSH